MGLFDKMKQAAANVSGNQTVTFTFQALPESLAQMQALPEASLDTPFKTAALTVCALCAYGADKNIGLEMLNWLRGPRPLNGQEISFLNDRFRDGKSYIPFSYFVGASPENGYTPRQPFTLLVGSDHTSNTEEGYFDTDPADADQMCFLPTDADTEGSQLPFTASYITPYPELNVEEADLFYQEGTPEVPFRSNQEWYATFTGEDGSRYAVTLEDEDTLALKFYLDGGESYLSLVNTVYFARQEAMG